MVKACDSVLSFQDFDLFKLIQRTMMMLTQDIIDTKQLSEKKLTLNTWVLGEEKRENGIRR